MTYEFILNTKLFLKYLLVIILLCGKVVSYDKSYGNLLPALKNSLSHHGDFLLIV